MKFEANFDGCSLGLESSSHEPLRKPWKVISSLQRLCEPLSQCVCRGDHAHGLTHEQDAVRSSFYTPAVVDLIGRAILACD
eukprot:15681504-Heterocapsa_arctica.AAC.1